LKQFLLPKVDKLFRSQVGWWRLGDNTRDYRGRTRRWKPHNFRYRP